MLSLDIVLQKSGKRHRCNCLESRCLFAVATTSLKWKKKKKQKQDMDANFMWKKTKKTQKAKATSLQIIMVHTVIELILCLKTL